MQAYTILEAQSNFATLAQQVIQTHKPVAVKNDGNNLVIMSESDYESLQETLYLQSIPGLVKDILEASKEPLEECVKWTDEV
jgi:PHD/YefM family antitoxin component YafN of YafNO toxin-antitoxin module